MELGYGPALELGHSLGWGLGYNPALELGSGPACVLGCERYLEYSPALELGREKTPPHEKHFKPKVWHKI